MLEPRSTVVLVVALLGCACDDAGRGRGPGRAEGESSDDVAAGAEQASAGAGQGGFAADVTTLAASVVGSGSGGGEGGGCPEPPSPDACAEVAHPGACGFRGCSAEFYDELRIGDDGCERVFDVPGCLPVVTCGCEPPRELLRFRGDRVIEWDQGCLEGWEPCVGAEEEPAACRC